MCKIAAIFQGTPEMRRAPLDKVVLDTKLLDFGSPKDVLAFAMSPPDVEAIEQNVMMLKEIGALLPTVANKPVKDDGDLTVLGEILASLPIDNRCVATSQDFPSFIFGHVFGHCYTFCGIIFQNVVKPWYG